MRCLSALLEHGVFVRGAGDRRCRRHRKSTKSIENNDVEPLSRQCSLPSLAFHENMLKGGGERENGERAPLLEIKYNKKMKKKGEEHCLQETELFFWIELDSNDLQVCIRDYERADFQLTAKKKREIIYV